MRIRVPMDPVVESGIYHIVLVSLLAWSIIQIGLAIYTDMKCECPCLERVK